MSTPYKTHDSINCSLIQFNKCSQTNSRKMTVSDSEPNVLHPLQLSVSSSPLRYAPGLASSILCPNPHILRFPSTNGAPGHHWKHFLHFISYLSPLSLCTFFLKPWPWLNPILPWHNIPMAWKNTPIEQPLTWVTSSSPSFSLQDTIYSFSLPPQIHHSLLLSLPLFILNNWPCFLVTEAMKRRRLNIPISTSSQTYCCCRWPPFTVSGPSKHLSKASPPPGLQTSSSSYVVASLCIINVPCLLIYWIFPSAYKHTGDTNNKKIKRTSPDTYLFQLPLHFSDLTYGKTEQ